NARPAVRAELQPKEDNAPSPGPLGMQIAAMQGEAIGGAKMNLLGVCDRLSARNDKERRLLEDAHQKTHIALQQIEIQIGQGQRYQERDAQDDAQGEPKPKHRCDSLMNSKVVSGEW